MDTEQLPYFVSTLLDHISWHGRSVCHEFPFYDLLSDIQLMILTSQSCYSASSTSCNWVMRLLDNRISLMHTCSSAWPQYAPFSSEVVFSLLDTHMNKTRFILDILSQLSWTDASDE